MRVLPLSACALLLLTACRPGDEAPSAAAGDGPRLGVLVVVDQLRADLLDRYDAAFTGGFRRLRDGGALFVNTTHDHAETATAPGHATVATGVMPRTHGIAGNSWFERVGDDWRSVYSMADTTVRILADPGLPGRSPAPLRVDGIGDWIVDADPGALVVAISRKDRGAIPLAGHAGQHVYWLALENGVGGFTTSSWYRDDLPEWVREANAALSPTLWGDTVWTFAPSDALAALTRPDPHPREADGVHTTFPHRAHAEVDMFDRRAWGEWLKNAPPPDAAVTALATRALRALDLGRRGPVDLLALSYSSTDGVGHTFGPRSREQLDNLMRLDRELATLMDSLDAHVGPGRWTLALTADHGVLDFPELRAEEGRPGGRLSPERLEAADAALAEVVTGDGGRAAADAIRASGLAAAVYPRARLRAGEAADSFEALYVNGFVEDRVPSFPGLEVAVRLPEGTTSDAFGTGHGSPYHYDRWVPFVVYGAGVQPGIHPERAATVDVAPTLAALLGIPVPPGLDGRSRLR